MPPGERLLRVHRITIGRSPDAFNRTIAPPGSGGRFDTVDGSYGHLYTAATPAGAVAEALLRGSLAPTASARVIPMAALAGRGMTELELLSPAPLVSLRGPDVGHVCQDAWLTKCDSSDYHLTQAWGVAIRAWHPAMSGMVWWARKNEHELVHVLYDDRLPTPAVRVVGSTVPIDSGPGLELVRLLLAAHNVTVS